ncbi:unnamed protein product, partial [Ixodes hexagonus]
LKNEAARKLHRQNDFMFDSESMNLLYSGSRNQLVVPLGALHAPIFFEDGPVAYNYGALGSMFGHTLLHAIDLGGMAVTDDGRGTYDMKDDFIKFYKGRLPCLRRLLNDTKSQVPGFDPNTPGLHRIHDSENLASVEGTRVAYMAFRKATNGLRDPKMPWTHPDHGGYNAEQLFFVAHCAPLCRFKEERTGLGENLGRSRCLRPLMNMREFADAFHCPKGSFMNPPDKCTIFDYVDGDSK